MPDEVKIRLTYAEFALVLRGVSLLRDMNNAPDSLRTGEHWNNIAKKILEQSERIIHRLNSIKQDLNIP